MLCKKSKPEGAPRQEWPPTTQCCVLPSQSTHHARAPPRLLCARARRFAAVDPRAMRPASVVSAWDLLASTLAPAGRRAHACAALRSSSPAGPPPSPSPAPLLRAGVAAARAARAARAAPAMAPVVRATRRHASASTQRNKLAHYLGAALKKGPRPGKSRDLHPKAKAKQDSPKRGGGNPNAPLWQKRRREKDSRPWVDFKIGRDGEKMANVDGKVRAGLVFLLPLLLYWVVGAGCHTAGTSGERVGVVVVLCVCVCVQRAAACSVRCPARRASLFLRARPPAGPSALRAAAQPPGVPARTHAHSCADTVLPHRSGAPRTTGCG